MDSTTFNSVVTLIAIGVTVLGGVVGLMTLRRRRVKPHWSTPKWKVTAVKVRTTLLPVLRLDWAVRGEAEILDVLCSIAGPQTTWRSLTVPKGSVKMGASFFTYIDLTSGQPFNTVTSSPVHVGKPVTSIVDRAVKGRYTLRIQWREQTRPRKLREKSFSYTVA